MQAHTAQCGRLPPTMKHTAAQTIGVLPHSVPSPRPRAGPAHSMRSLSLRQAGGVISTAQRRGQLAVLSALRSGKSWDRPEDDSHSHSPARPQELQEGSGSSSGSGAGDSAKEQGGGQLQLLISVIALIGFGVANRVLYKMALVPMGNYVFFLAQFQTFGYCAVYFAALAIRYRTGAISSEQLKQAPIKLLAAIGLIEALSQVSGFIGASKLPGVVLPLLQQSVMFFNIAFSRLVLRKKLAWQQYVGALAVVVGVCFAALPESGGTSIFAGLPLKYIAIFVVSMMFPALDSITKEKVFTESKERLNGQDLDIFVVNSFASGFQALSVALMLPGIASLRGIGWQNLPGYLVEGTKVFMGANGNGAPLLPILYVAANLAFNICSLLVVRTSGALANSLAIAALTPLTLWAFSFDLPYLGTAPQLGPQFLLGSAILIGGLLTYNSPSLIPQIKAKFGKDD